MDKCIHVANIPIRIIFQKNQGALKDFFDEFPQTNKKPQLTIILQDGLSSSSPAFLVAGSKIQKNSLQHKDSLLTVGHKITHDDSGYTVYIDTNDTTHFKLKQRLKLIRFFNRFYPDKSMYDLMCVLFGVFHYLVQILFVKAGSSYIHASCVEKDGKALLLPAWGGTGKTSLMYQFVMFGGWKFLADDLAIISKDGTVYSNPSPIAVYPYNLKGLPEIKKMFMELQGSVEKLQWHLFRRLYGEKGATRRVSPTKLFGTERIAKTGKLDQVVSLIRWDEPHFAVHKTTVDEMASRATSTIFTEIRQFRYEYNAWTTAPGFNLFPSSLEVAKSTHSVFKDAFADCDLSILSIPKNATPPELYKSILKQLK